MRLSLKANVPQAPEGRQALYSLLSPSQSPPSSHTAALLSSIKPSMESVSQTRLQDPFLAAGEQLWVVKFFPFLTLHPRMFGTWFLEGKTFKPPHGKRPLETLQGSKDLFQK